MADVFISYRRVPSFALAKLIQSDLKNDHQIDAYLDVTRTDGARVQFPARLLNAIQDAPIFICILGDGTLDSEWVLKEIHYAYELGKPCIPIFHEHYRPVASDDPAVAYLLNFDAVHYMDQRGIMVDESTARLARFIKHTLPEQVPPKRNNQTSLFALIALLLVLIGGGVVLSGVLNQEDQGTRLTETAVAINSSETPAPTDTEMPVPTATPTEEPTLTNTETPVPTETPTEEPTATATSTETPEPTATPTNTSRARVSSSPTEKAETMISVVPVSNLGEIAMFDGRFNSLIELMSLTGLTDRFMSTDNYTIFAPTDEALGANAGIMQGLMRSPISAQSIIGAHAVEGVYTVEDLTALEGELVTLLEGAPITFSVNDEGVIVLNNNEASIIQSIPATNGIIHIIDAVILEAPMQVAAQMMSQQ